MEDEIETLDVLLNAMISAHELQREEYESGNRNNFVHFTEAEIQSIAAALWIDRYTESRRNFQEVVGKTLTRFMEQQ